MTYAGFLMLFLALPLGILVVILRKRLLDKRFLAIAGGLTLVALLYMAPWDHIASIWGLWMWAGDRTWGVRWWSIPPEEYLFCILEALLAITLIYALLTRKDRKDNVREPMTPGIVKVSGTSIPSSLHTTTTREAGQQRSGTGESDQEAGS